VIGEWRCILIFRKLCLRISKYIAVIQRTKKGMEVAMPIFECFTSLGGGLRVIVWVPATFICVAVHVVVEVLLETDEDV